MLLCMCQDYALLFIPKKFLHAACHVDAKLASKRTTVHSAAWAGSQTITTFDPDIQCSY